MWTKGCKCKGVQSETKKALEDASNAQQHRLLEPLSLLASSPLSLLFFSARLPPPPFPFFLSTSSSISQPSLSLGYR